MPGEVFDQERVISQIDFRCREQTPCLFFFNATALGSYDSDLNIKVYIDEIANDFISVNTLYANEHRTISFSLTIKEKILKIITLAMSINATDRKA